MCIFSRYLLFLLQIKLTYGLFGNTNSDSSYTVEHHEPTPRLEDFFWTGSGDGPPPPAPPPALRPDPPAPAVHTTTVLATVYLDSYPAQEVTDKTTGACVANCEDPIPLDSLDPVDLGDPGHPGGLHPDIPDDRRYWLLTVIQGSTPNSLQLKLAKLYQRAFLRQQEKHLGIIKSLDAPTPRKKHEVQSFVVPRDYGIEPSNTPPKYEDVETFGTSKSTALNNLNDTKQPNIDTIIIDNETEIKPTRVHESWILATMNKRDVTDREEFERQELMDAPMEVDQENETAVYKREIIKPEQQPPVYVHIQNITESPQTGSVDIVYVVLVGGRPVPAAVAARDMRLVRDAEVASELGAVVTTKAEPYLRAAEGLAGEAGAPSMQGTELWALAVGALTAALLLLVLALLLCRFVRRKKTMSASSLRAFRDAALHGAGAQLHVSHGQHVQHVRHVHEEKDGKLISVMSPKRVRPSSALQPTYRAASASSSSTTSSGVAEVAAAMKRKYKKPHALKMATKKRGTTHSLLESAGAESSDSREATAPGTPTSYLSMPSVRAFPRGNTVEPLSRVLEPVTVRHLDVSPAGSPKTISDFSSQRTDSAPRRQMASQLVRMGSIDKDPGVIGPMVWDLHCQRIKDAKPSSPATSSASTRREPPVSRMRSRFNELVEDAFSLFGSPGGSPAPLARHARVTEPTQARNEHVRRPATAAAAHARAAAPPRAEGRPRTSAAQPPPRRPPGTAWLDVPPPTLQSAKFPPIPTVNPAFILSEGRLRPEDPALPLISAIKSEIQKLRDNAHKPM